MATGNQFDHACRWFPRRADPAYYVAIGDDARSHAMNRSQAELLLDQLPDPRPEGFRREVLIAVLTGPLAWVRVSSIPCAEHLVGGLASEGLVTLWPDHPEGAHVTLSKSTAAALGVEIECIGRVVYERVEEHPDARPLRCLAESERWALAGSRAPLFMPRVSGFSRMNFPDAASTVRNPVEAAPRDGPDPRWARIAELHRALKPRSPKKKKRRKKARSKGPSKNKFQLVPGCHLFRSTACRGPIV
jgi:hypothetical protein